MYVTYSCNGEVVSLLKTKNGGTSMETQKYDEAITYISKQINIQPTIGLILGSGLSGLADEFTKMTKIPYEQIPHFPRTTVPGHSGHLVIGMFEEKPLIAMRGRFHFYEGYSLEEVTFPVRVMKKLGVNQLI